MEGFPPTAPRVSRILFGVYAALSFGVLVAAMISPPVRALAYAPLRDLVLPPPEPVVVELLYSTEKAAWLEEAIERYYDTRPYVRGHPVQISTQKMGSREMVLAVLEGRAQPDLISPASSLQLSILQDASGARYGYPVVNRADTQRCRPVLRSPLVLVSWKERADVLWAQGANGSLWQHMYDALTDPRGWAAYGHSEWGYIKFGHTTPLKSNSGLQTVLLMTYDYFGRSSGLTAEEILTDAAYQQWLIAFEHAVSKFGDSTGTYMQEIIAYGPSMYDLVAVYEATAIEHAENAIGRYGELAIYYPPATSVSDHPFCVVEADWVSADETQAAERFLAFLTGPEIQQVALLRYGFRPVDPNVPLAQPGSPWERYAGNGLRVSLPPEVEVPPGHVLDTLLEFWARNVQP
ncbi:MAG: substrate-binding domain-containing protein [Anaerolineae bacterium]|nr:substrate-binding domain-containing protein [Anaerolineae bacterium]